MRNLLYILTFYFAFLPAIVFSQDQDSTFIKPIEKILEDARPMLGSNQQKVLENAKKALADSRKYRLKIQEAHSLRMIGYYYLYESDYDKAIESFERALTLCQQEKDTSGIIDEHMMIGQSLYFKGLYNNAMKHYNVSYQLAVKTADSAQMASLLFEIGWTQYSQTNLKLAQTSFLEALKIQEKIGVDEESINSLYNALGNIYFEFSDYDRALDYYNKSLALNKKSNNRLSEAHTINNLGNVFLKQGHFDLALSKYEEAKKLFEFLNNLQGVAMTLNNMGMAYEDKGNSLKAIRFYEESVKIKKDIGDLAGVSRTMGIIADLLIKEQDYSHAIRNLDKSMEIARNIHLTAQIKDNYKSYSQAYKKMGDKTKALEYFEKFFEMHDSIFNQETQSLFTEMQTRYETEEKQKEIELLNSEKKLQDIELSERNAVVAKQRIIISTVIGGLVLLLLFSVVVYRQYRQKKQANEVLRHQKEEIQSQRDQLSELNEELLSKNEEIMSQRDKIENQRDEIGLINRDVMASIRYALRIQQALLPEKADLEKMLGSHLIIYLPKDIVSGDFYWIRSRKEADGSETIIVACADCTGHGVPGAFMSIVAMNLLEKAFFTEKLVTPAEALNYITNSIHVLLQHSDEQSLLKDGMDIALCLLNRKQGKIEFSGAKNSLIHISGGILNEYKGDKHFIGDPLVPGVFDSYTNQVIQVNAGDLLYMYSDGYADQFGFSNGKKFNSSKLKQLLLHVSDAQLHEQEQMLIDEHNNWKGHLQQIDDILLLGFKA